MTETALAPRLDPRKFKDPRLTAKGEPRARVALTRLEVLWFNTGTLCNLACRNCYIESSPANDRLVYLTAAEVAGYLDEIGRDGLGTGLIGFTGGEPFLNPDLPAMLDDVLRRGLRALVLTNGMRPMMKAAQPLLALKERYGAALTLRVSVDHYDPALHQAERGARSWRPMLDGLRWLAANGFALTVAGRGFSGEEEGALRRGYARLFAENAIPLDARDPAALILFPEMDAGADVPEVSEGCWAILGKSPGQMMCATSRMVVKRKGAGHPVVLSCTLLPDDPQFELGHHLSEAAGPVPLNHPHCARFCALGGASCGQG